MKRSKWILLVEDEKDNQDFFIETLLTPSVYTLDCRANADESAEDKKFRVFIFNLRIQTTFDQQSKFFGLGNCDN